ncbi:branched-chain amino acid ABC transporter permease [Labrys monachus]|uniref:Branched-chain amino acid transport system permease protein n=1 Tax=Labrys monachus TaxID=217067 RepID=A0ABU0FII2_9HYPH|nr:branched-chain amino acid ABC transporter permease [Labrys monachus]MDQ0394422.1 branched-chain amino acid transport system permease protein [Labrys monachus]
MIRDRFTAWRILGAVLVLAAALAAPQVLTSAVAQNLAILSLLYAVVASNWDLTLGYAGIFNFAHVAFFGIGSYVAAISTLQFDLPVWWDLVLAVAVVMVVGAIVSALALRLRGIYVALVTFALTQLCVALINSQKDLTGGPVGLIGVPDLQIGDFAFGSDPRSYFYAAEILLIASTIAMRWLATSNFGLSLVALRDYENYAVSRGIPARRQRVLAIVISSIPTSLAGCLYAHYLIVASPDVFSFSLTTLLLTMVLVGGAGTIYGPILAAFVLTVGTEELSSLGNFRYMIVAALIVLTLRFLPGGIWSLRRWRRPAAPAPLSVALDEKGAP